MPLTTGASVTPGNLWNVSLSTCYLDRVRGQPILGILVRYDVTGIQNLLIAAES